MVLKACLICAVSKFGIFVFEHFVKFEFRPKQ